MTDKTKPISASNPPPSKVHLREQHSPIFVSEKEETLQKDERVLDVEQQAKEKEVEEKTQSKKKRTRITDA